jgi:riboflavin kinase/FMN adenylyltransferase
VEVHLLDFEGDLYGRELEVAFQRKVRAEIKFPTLEALRKQIAADIAAIGEAS